MKIEALASSSSGNLYRISQGGHAPILLECGIPIAKLKAKLNYKLSEVCGCLLTHSHSDHSLAASDILKCGVPLYASQGTVDALSLSGHNLHIVEVKQPGQPGKWFFVGDWSCLAFPTVHDTVGSCGFIVKCDDEALVFATDTQYVHDRFNGLTHVLIECNWSFETLDPDLEPFRKKRLLATHMGLHETKRFLESNDLSKVQEIHLIHLSSGNGDGPYFRDEIQKLTGIPTYLQGDA